MLSNRIKQLEPSPTLSLDGKVKELQKNGRSVINLGLGEPDFPTPKNIGEAAIGAIKSGFTHYTAVAGIPDLKLAICSSLKKNNDLEYSPDEIVVGAGSKVILYNIFQVLCNPGDEVILSTPTWSTYIEQIKLAGGVPVLIPLEAPFKLTAEQVAEKITSRTKLVLLNSPANPTGAMIEKSELEKIGKLAKEKNIWIVSDEIYDRLTYGSNHISIASLGEEIKKHVIVVNGLSKSYAMTGWRIGFAAGPKEIINGIVSLQGQTTSNASSIGQKAAIEALNGDQTPVEEMRREFEKRRNFLVEEIGKIEGLSFQPPEGAFYFFVSVKKLLSQKISTSKDWCAALLEKEGVAVVPGEAFQAPGYFRLSYASSMEELSSGVEKIKSFVQSL